ncbi:MAG TPA: PQQ-dependent sugar dehydrogenase [Bacillales bacterium]|nr:PQQ-dependent sugar dehydrogenase [Bacillales bacterium]
MKRGAMLVSLSLAVAVSAVGCSDQSESEPRPQDERKTEQTSSPSDMDSKVLATDLDVPWNIVKHGDIFYISERPGKIVKIDENGDVHEMPLQLAKNVVQSGEGGLLGFVLSPDFDASKTAYVYHTYKQNGKLFNHIVKIKWTGNKWIETDVLLDGIPGGPIHNGGRLKFGPNGKLFATTGDASAEENAQELDSLSGKILRMNTDGSIPETNPFSDSYVYSYGHRNPQGLAWSGDGKMYEAEHGLSAHDEINLIEPGKNYGWPAIRGEETKEDMVSPLFQSGEETWAPSGLAYYNGALYIAGLRGEQIRRFDLENHTSKVIFHGAGRLRDILIQDRAAYVITNNTDGRGTPRPHDDRLMKIDLGGGKK